MPLCELSAIGSVIDLYWYVIKVMPQIEKSYASPAMCKSFVFSLTSF